MTVSLIFLMALAAVAAALITLYRVIGWKRVLRHATAIDIGFTVLVCLALAGTLTGILIGIIAGLVMTGTLTVAKAVQGRVERLYDRPTATPTEDWCPGGTPRSL